MKNNSTKFYDLKTVRSQMVKGKKYLQKNEVRKDLNPEHFNKYGIPHDAFITAKRGHKFKANTKTHAEFINGVKCLDLEPNKGADEKHSRVSPPFWQSEKQFGDKKSKTKIPKKIKSKIQRYNRKFNI